MRQIIQRKSPAIGLAVIIGIILAVAWASHATADTCILDPSTDRYLFDFESFYRGFSILSGDCGLAFSHSGVTEPWDTDKLALFIGIITAAEARGKILCVEYNSDLIGNRIIDGINWNPSWNCAQGDTTHAAEKKVKPKGD